MRKPKPHKLTAVWLKRHGFTNALWRLEERERLIKAKTPKAGGLTMGWNDHVEQVETECLDCGEVDAWWMWDEVGKQRYVGKVGEMLGVDATKGNRCPHCGSTRGAVIEDEEDDW
jgi:hypothetical protein